MVILKGALCVFIHPWERRL